MHEFSVASGIIETALAEAEKHNAVKLSKITVEVGQLSMVSIEQLKFSLDILKEDTIAAGAEIEIIKTPVKMKCDKGHETEAFLDEPLFNAMQKIKCSKCDTKPEIIGGRECWIKEIEVE